MVRRGNLAVFEGSSISETGDVTPTKIGVHVFDINPYLYEIFELILFNSIFSLPYSWSERQIPFFDPHISVIIIVSFIFR